MKERTMVSLIRRSVGILALAMITYIFQAGSVLAEDRLTVSNISTKDRPGYALSWPRDKGNASVERSEDGGKTFTTLSQTDLNFYMDVDVAAASTYVYRVSNPSFSLTSGSAIDVVGKPLITAIKIEAGATSKSEASAIVTFKTEILSNAQVYYGESTRYGSETLLETNLNQSHTIIIDKLLPSTTYHLKIKTINKGNTDTAESEDQMFVTQNPPRDMSILQIVIDALSKAFEGFAKWFNS